MVLTNTNNKNRIIYYIALVFICSLYDAPDYYKINKSNILNQWFVKLGWFWTIISLIPLQFSSLQDHDKEGLSRSIFKVVLSSILWYISVNIFQFIDDKTGFDISGHTFLLIFSNLILCHELYVAKERKVSALQNNQVKQAKTSNDSKSTSISTCLPILANIPLIANKSFFEVANYQVIFISALWDFMLIQTALFYHTLIQKVIALVWAVASWYLLHNAFDMRQRRQPAARSSM